MRRHVAAAVAIAALWGFWVVPRAQAQYTYQRPLTSPFYRPPVSSRRRIWVARPAPANHECLQILPVDWLAIVQGGATRTNYQLFPGDRVYIKADPFIALDNWLAKVFAPVERLLGISLLGATTFQTFRNNGLHGNRNGTGFIVTGF